MKYSKVSISYSVLLVAALIARPHAVQADGAFNGGSDSKQEQAETKNQSVFDKLIDRDRWEFTVGAGGDFGPKYEGSDKIEFSPGFLIEAAWDDTIFLGPDGIGANLYEGGDFSVSGSLSYGGGREESEDANLRGLGDIDSSTMVNLNFEYEFGLVSPYVSVTKHFGGTDGLQAQIGAQTAVPIKFLTGEFSEADLEAIDDPLPAGPMLSFGVSTDWADGNYNGDHFGVNAQQSARSGLRRHDAGAGFKSINVDVGLMYPITESWSADAVVGYSHLIGDAGDSPIVRKEGQLSGGLSLSYKF